MITICLSFTKKALPESANIQIQQLMLTPKKQFSADKNGAYALGDIDKFCVQLNRNGQLLCASAGDVLLSRTLGNGVEGGLGRLFLRVHVADSIQWHVLLLSLIHI